MSRLRVEVDTVAYGLSPFGGLISYWDAVLPRLACEVSLRARIPDRLRVPLPIDQTNRPDGWVPDVFVSTYYTAAPAGIPSVVIVHDTILEEARVDQAAAGDVLTEEEKRACIRAAARIVVPSQATRNAVARYYPDVVDRVEVVPHGVEPVFARQTAPEHLAAAKALLGLHGVSGDFVLHVGGRTQYKDFVTLIAAIQEVRTSFPDVRLVAVGSETVLHENERVVPGADDVALVGYVPREVLAGLYRLASVVASASRAEGFGLPILEAAAANKCVVCTDLPVFREVAAPGTKFFGSGNSRAAAAALRAAIVEGRLRVVRGRRTRSWDDAARGLLGSLEDAASTHG